LRRHLKKKQLERPWYRRHENITLDLKEMFNCHELASSYSE
jgi:hypothetical protein